MIAKRTIPSKIIFLTFLVSAVLAACGVGSKPIVSDPALSGALPQLFGEWKVSGNGVWENSTLVFQEGGNITIKNDSQGKTENGTFIFLNIKTLVFEFPSYRGSMTVESNELEPTKITIKLTEPTQEEFTAEKINK